jgi:hypothetical protein
MKRSRLKQCAFFLMFGFLLGQASAQFLEDFSGRSIRKDKSGINGWAFFTGDGEASMDFRAGESYGSVLVDATKDRRNIWWALIKRDVSAALDLSRLSKPDYELRIEARIRVSHAPRRVNLHLNTQKTVDFHTHLMEFDIPDTQNWHTISMTTRDFEAEPGDRVFGQLALMDWGLGKYRVDVDYFKVDVVNIATVRPDLGTQVPYHPPVPDPDTFAFRIDVAQDSMIDIQYPDVNFNGWQTEDEGQRIKLLTVSGTQSVIMRWDLSAFSGRKVSGYGLLELTTYSVSSSPSELEEFGKVRVAEILGGDPGWNQETVTLSSLCEGQSLERVLNSQMIIDVDVVEGQGSRTLITISNPVLQRMIEGKTLGLAIRPLGAINASFFSTENQDGKFGPRLLLNIQE